MTCAYPAWAPTSGYAGGCRCQRCKDGRKAYDAARTRVRYQHDEVQRRAERVKRWLMAAGYKYADIDGATTALARLHVCGPDRAARAYELAVSAGRPSQSQISSAIHMVMHS